MVHAAGAMFTNTLLLNPRIIWICVFQIAADVFYFISTLSLYLILIARLYSTFIDTNYRLSKPALFALGMSMSIQALLMIAYCANLVIFPCVKPMWCQWSAMLALSITVIDYVLNFLLFALFIRKLRQLVFARLYHHISMDAIDGTLDDQPNSRLLDVITKQVRI